MSGEGVVLVLVVVVEGREKQRAVARLSPRKRSAGGQTARGSELVLILVRLLPQLRGSCDRVQVAFTSVDVGGQLVNACFASTCCHTAPSSSIPPSPVRLPYSMR